MNKIIAATEKEVLDYLIKAGIWVEDGKVAKADITKVKEAMSKYKSIAAGKDELDAAQAKILQQIYKLLESVGDEAKEHLVTNLYKIADVLNNDEEEKERFNEIDAKFKELTK